jgi:hypothetical protein
MMANKKIMLVVAALIVDGTLAAIFRRRASEEDPTFDLLPVAGPWSG